MAKAKEKTVALRVLLIKDAIEKHDDIFKEFDSLKHVELSKHVPFAGLFAWRGQFFSDPGWLAFVKPHLDGDIGKLRNASTAAVLIVEAEGRRFAFTFGHGRSLLNPEAFERDFGLKIALNTIDPESIRSIDCRNFEELTVQTRRQTSRASTLDSFGLTATQDLLRQVTGEPTDKDFAKRVSGSDALMFSAPITLPNLGAKCKALLAAYNSKEYRKRGFKFIDYLHRERDPSKINELDALLVTAITTGDHDKIHMAPPEPVDMQDVDKFIFASGKNHDEYDELEVSDMVAEIGGDSEVSVEALKRQRVGVKYGGGGFADLRWSAYSSLVYETDHGGARYVLTCGEWFEVSKTFVKAVEKKVKGLATAATLSLPNAKSKTQSEDSYNKMLKKDLGYVLLDKRCNRAMGTEIEVCDLLTKQKQFIHVKRKTRSATLSHLFAQGVISADCFLSDDEYRKEVKALVAESDPMLAASIKDDRPKTSDYEIVYAILGKSTPNWPLSLPFFSQLNLMNAADHLANIQYRVSLVHVVQQ